LQRASGKAESTATSSHSRKDDFAISSQCLCSEFQRLPQAIFARSAHGGKHHLAVCLQGSAGKLQRQAIGLHSLKNNLAVCLKTAIHELQRQPIGTHGAERHTTVGT
jgi:hypothetical protein